MKRSFLAVLIFSAALACVAPEEPSQAGGGPVGDKSLSGGFSAVRLAEDLPGVSAPAKDRLGNLWVAVRERGEIVLLELDGERITRVAAILTDLEAPSAVALDPEHDLRLYFAEARSISQVDLYTEDDPERIFSTPEGYTIEALAFGSKGRLHASLSREATPCGAIHSMTPDGGGDQVETKGPQAAAALTVDRDGVLWAAKRPCSEAASAGLAPVGKTELVLATEAAPIGLAFAPGWGEPSGDALVAALGKRGLALWSRNNKEGFADPHPISVNGLSRPSGLLATVDGSLFVSDSAAGEIWSLRRSRRGASPVRVAEPPAGQLVASPLTVRGEAPGNWFFEGSLPVRLVDVHGEMLAAAQAEARGEWMTEQPVAFRATLDFDEPTAAEGALVVKKANPSGLPENAGEQRVAVRFR